MPSPYGYAAAIDSMGTIAAPLLASISIALIALVVSDAKDFTWVNVTLAFLIVAASAFVAAVEFTFSARQYAVSPSEIEDWWPDHDHPERREMLKTEQLAHRLKFQYWGSRARLAYDIAILALSLGVITLLVPNRGLLHVGLGRLVVLILGVLGLLAEFAWIARTRIASLRKRD